MAILKGRVSEAATLLTIFTLVLVIRNYNSLASPNLFISHLNQHFRATSSKLDTRTDQDQSPANRNVPQLRVALCLVGGARAFELTAESILRHLIEPHNDWAPDVFLHAPLDSDAHKFTLLGNVSGRLASARIFRPEAILESNLHREVLNARSSPNRIQGLLQYFNLVEGCLAMIVEYENRFGFRYDWVARTRVDSFWTGPVPPLASLDASTYYVPIGSQFGGFNDRLGLGSRNVTVIALSRLSLLPYLHERGHRNMNSESAFKAQLEELQVPCETIAVPFCILFRRIYSWPIDTPKDVPVVSIATPGALNGAKCRPCTPAASGSEAQAVVNNLSKRWGWPGHVRGLALCNGSGNWEENYEALYTAAAGTTFEQQRKQILSRTREQCEADVQRFGKQWKVWDAPPAEHFCNHLT